MSGEIQVTAPTEEEALAEVLDRLQVERDAVEYEVSSEDEDSLLPGAKPQVQIRAWIRPDFVAEKACARVADILRHMRIETEVTHSVRNKVIFIDIGSTEDSSLLIGRDGQNLEALQYLINRMILRIGREAPMVVVDVEGYRRRQFDELEDLVERAVKRARETGNEIELDSMPAGERKYLHNYLQEFEGVKTFSRGDPPDRYLVIIAD